ncbi:DUF3793 family protein [uncultured Ruthenibacterium sp.]|uniref:DUF3793 family protein n=1 Tax=uncultured Ruthenibacterium sp. TaxID=1905347 RepID=UPI00349ED588
MDLLEQALAKHCAPVLLGAKAANLVAVDVDKVPALTARVQQLRWQLAGCGLEFTVLCCCKRRGLLLVYRPAALARRLQRDRHVLARFGYAQNGTLQEHLQRLQDRLRRGKGFPHEIGLFLDYPTEDVLGFVEKGGSACKLCGYWKVYGDVKAAKERFARFDACRQRLCRGMEQGVPLVHMVRADG